MSDPKDAEREISSSAGLKEEPGESAPSEPESPRSQAFLDLQASGLTPAEIAAARAETDNPTAAGEAPQKRPAAPGQAHWLALLSLSAAGSLALASASLPVRGLSFWLNGLAGLAVLLLLPSFMPHPPRFLPRLATRGGLAAALFSAALFLTAVFEGLGLIFFYTLPLALAWAGLSALVIIWTIAALGRKLGRRHKTAGFILALVLLYAALGPAWLLLGPFFPGAAGPADFFHRNIFSASPAFLTAHLPWPAWPQAV
ncbi:MAG: hypothetical protein LBV21_05950, partial [Candidatus Adiutrix sp.]|nr:hypothetical protein [Candidatus Adiutrix sp.]